MKKLIEAIKPLQIVGDEQQKISKITFDSRIAEPGAMFVAIRGTVSDGHDYIEKAVTLGAAAVVCERLPEVLDPKVCYLKVEDSSVALAHLGDAFYDHPSRKLKLVGVTGTNGKTTIATLLHGLFTKLGYPSGLLSTVVNIVGSDHRSTTHTTPDPLTINALLSEMVDAGCQYCFMEVSSHSVVQHRITALNFCGGVFTNLTHDHLDYHHTFAEYLKAKKGFFDTLPNDSFAIVNADDRNGMVMVQNCMSRKIATYSLTRMADYRCKVQESSLEGMLLQINDLGAWMQFIGRFNAYNLTAIYATAVELGFDSEQILTAMSTLTPVAGRMECVRSASGILGVVDYAHTPDALENVLKTIQDFNSSGSKVITVVGCGGDRDATKRPIMATIAATLSDRVILTSDNPRTENPTEILRQMEQGLQTPTQKAATLTIESRHDAIRTAVALAHKGDIILVAGKGHETYQEISGIRHHFDDKEELTAAFVQ